MLSSTELRAGMTIRIEGALYRVISANYHAGGGKMGGVTHAKLRNLITGTFRESRFRPDETIDQIELDKQTMQFLYSDGDLVHFMNPESYEQVTIPVELLGHAASYLGENMLLTVEFFEGAPIGVRFPDSVEARVTDTAPPVHSQGTDNVWKEARLENGVQIMVPPFIAVGELIRVDVERGRYIERSKSDRRK
jgi:elongation factor P